MKRKKAKEILAESFRELAEKRSIDKITVKDITDNCGYSIATFYRQFQDKYDLIAWNYSQGVETIMDKIGANGYSWSQTLLDGTLYFHREKMYLANLLLHTNGQNSFIRNMVEINIRAMKKYITQTLGEEALNDTLELYIRLYCMGTVHLTGEWLLKGCQHSPEEMAVIYKNSLPRPLEKLLSEADDKLAKGYMQSE